MLTKLLERTKELEGGFRGLEKLDQFLSKHIHDSFIAFTNSLNIPAQNILIILTLLKAVNMAQPKFLEKACLNSFLQMLQRLVRDYITPIWSVDTSTYTHIDPMQKATANLIIECLELVSLINTSFIFIYIILNQIQPYVKTISFDSQRVISDYILIPLSQKNPIDRIFDIGINVRI